MYKVKERDIPRLRMLAPDRIYCVETIDEINGERGKGFRVGRVVGNTIEYLDPLTWGEYFTSVKYGYANVKNLFEKYPISKTEKVKEITKMYSLDQREFNEILPMYRPQKIFTLLSESDK